MKFNNAIKALACVGVMAAAATGIYAPAAALANDFTFEDYSWDTDPGTSFDLEVQEDVPGVDNVYGRAPRATFVEKFDEVRLNDSMEVEVLERYQDYFAAWKLGYWSPSRLKKAVRRALGLSAGTPVYMRIEMKDGVEGISFSGPGEALYNNGRWMYGEEVPYVD